MSIRQAIYQKAAAPPSTPNTTHTPPLLLTILGPNFHPEIILLRISMHWGPETACLMCRMK